MVVALATLVRHPRLGLTVLTGEENLNQPVLSVAVSELSDPAKYLAGGELVLTAGIGLPSGRQELEEYVERLVAVGSVGLGFGTGVVADAAPKPLVAAAEHAGLTLIEVDQATPFVSISKALADLMVQEVRAEILHIHRAHQEQSRAARTRGAKGVVRTLSTQLAGDVLLLDGAGRIREWSPAQASQLLPLVIGEVARLRSAGQTASSIVTEDRHIGVQTLGSGTSPRGFLVVGTGAVKTKLQRDLTAGAATLLSFGLDQETPRTERRLRQVALLRLVKTGVAPAAHELALLTEGLLRSDTIYVLAASGPAAQLRTWCRNLQDRGEGQALAGIIEGHAYGIVSTLEEARSASERAGSQLTVGVSRPSDVAHLKAAFDQAEQSCVVAATRGAGALHFEQLTSGVLSVADPRAARSFSHQLLAPLDAYQRESGIDLRASLQAWLDHHGHFDPAATSLGLHRHTLRHRIQRVARLLDRDLDDAETRVDLWFALRMSRFDPEHGP